MSSRNINRIIIHVVLMVQLHLIIVASSKEQLCSSTANHSPVDKTIITSLGPHNKTSLTVQDSALASQYGKSCQLRGDIDDCCNCTYQAIEELNNKVVNPLVTSLANAPFFTFFKVNIYCDCPLWPDDSMCTMQHCSVCECDPSEVPKAWLEAEKHSCSSKSHILGQRCDNMKCSAEMASRVNRQVDPALRNKLLQLQSWRGFDNPWMAEGEEDEEYLYINLLKNPERYTGYQGEHAHRIWSSIYGQSCFASIDCKEKLVFQRLISGIHSSINLHLSYKYLLDEMQGTWGPNLQEFKRRFGTPQASTYIDNLYFTYMFVLRAVLKAGPLLERFSYDTGIETEDGLVAQLIELLVNNKILAESCPMPFDEGRLWKGKDGHMLKQQLQEAFQNITRIMDCVGCEKCKLWGKLQTLGIATALKILFSSSDCDGQLPTSTSPFEGQLHLERNEVIALINLLERLSSSITYYRFMSNELESGQQSSQTPKGDRLLKPSQIG